jgi:hypothetical protein
VVRIPVILNPPILLAFVAGTPIEDEARTIPENRPKQILNASERTACPIASAIKDRIPGECNDY